MCYTHHEACRWLHAPCSAPSLLLIIDRDPSFIGMPTPSYIGHTYEGVDIIHRMTTPHTSYDTPSYIGQLTPLANRIPEVVAAQVNFSHMMGLK